MATVTMHILFIGNSYTNRNDLPAMLTALAAAADPPVAIATERVVANGASLRQHWNAGRAADLIRSQPWDFVVLQEQSTLPVKNRQRYHENVRLFADLVRCLGPRLALYHTWARRNAPETQDLLDQAVAEIAAETGALILPVGLAWRGVLSLPDAPELYDPDGSHPTPAASYLAACVMLAALLRRSPEGLPAPEGLRISPEQILLLQHTASAVVLATGT